MNSYYTRDELFEMGFVRLGDNVKISRKTSIYNANMMSIGNNVRIDDFSLISGKIVIGDYVHISSYVGMYAGDEGICMEDFSAIASKSTIYAISDDYSGRMMTNPTIPMKYRCIQKGKVILEKHVLIGASCVVLPGVTLNEGSVFGAMTLINRDSEPWSINVGIPFSKTKDREKNILKIEQDLMDEIKLF